MIRMLIAEDQPDAAYALCKNIDGRDGIIVLDIARNGQEAVDLCRKYNPDIVLMDIKMPVLNGIEASRIITKENPDIKILFLTLFADQAYIRESFDLQASGFILKGRSSSVLISCIKQVMAGLHVADQFVMQSAFPDAVVSESDQADRAKVSLLTPTEKIVISHIIMGRTNPEIAEAMNFTEGYVRNIISRILRKAELPNSKALASWGFRMGLQNM
jgi:DNA-binding NarL/FixJ family response regulator